MVTFPYLNHALLFTGTLAAIHSASALGPIHRHDIQTRVVHQFQNTTWLENIAVRENGQLLAGVIGRPELWQVDPFDGQANLVHNFTSVNSVFGITEVTKDVFAVAIGSHDTATATSLPGSFSVWTVDFNQKSTKVKLVTEIPEAVLLNGATTLSKHKRTVLVSDSGTGNIYRVNTNTGEYSIALSDDLTRPDTKSGPIGVNGIHIHSGYLYFTNSYRFFLGRVKIHGDGTAAGRFEKVADTKLGDDFAIDSIGNIYLTQESTLAKITPAGKLEHLLGNVNSTTVAGDCAAQFGRTREDQRTLYVVTNGGLSIPVNGTYIEGGKIVAVEILGPRGYAE